ncbi:helix-turn-helix domain-containing protein [Acetobacteraceae bacterium]|nr:helix-turn-helix domain-containing protein [Candidatus Parcubacteria bacterium]
MPHITKQQRREGVAPEFSEQLIELLVFLKGRSGRLFLKEFLTDTEQVMFAKRLAIILMLKQGQSYYQILKKFGVSVSTSRRIHEKLLKGDFRVIERVIKNKKQREHFRKCFYRRQRACGEQCNNKTGY